MNRALFVIALLASSTEWAWAKCPGERRLTSSLYWENDQKHWSFRGTDRFYTNGIRLSFVWAHDGAGIQPPCWVENAVSRLPLFNTLMGETLTRSYGVALGQNMYTPSDIARTELSPQDRPYGGWLYVGLIGHGFHLKDVDQRPDGTTPTPTLDRAQTLEVDLGIIGPAALAGETQALIHKIVDATRPEGWDNQIRNEPGLLVTYDGRWKNLEARRAAPAGPDKIAIREDNRIFDVATHVGGAVGNVFTFARTGVTARLGVHLSDDFGPGARIEALEVRARPRRNKAEAYLFGRAEGRSVLRNAFLDGNTFERSHHVEKQPFVADLEWGVSLRWSRVRLTWRQVRRSREFTRQPGKQIFGSWNVSLEPGSP